MNFEFLFLRCWLFQPSNKLKHTKNIAVPWYQVFLSGIVVTFSLLFRLIPADSGCLKNMKRPKAKKTKSENYTLSPCGEDARERRERRERSAETFGLGECCSKIPNFAFCGLCVRCWSNLTTKKGDPHRSTFLLPFAGLDCCVFCGRRNSEFPGSSYEYVESANVRANRETQ